MSHSVTIGGDRLGSGKKNRVELHGYERSTHDLSYAWRNTQSPGTLVPFMNFLALPGDTFDIELDADVQTHPTLGPLFGSFKLQIDVFEAPIRLYNALLHNNALDIGMDMSKVKFPQIKLKAMPINGDDIDWDNAQINPSSILAYLGIRGIGRTSDPAGTEREFNAIPLIAYWDIYKNYYANKQEGIGAVIHTPANSINKTITDVLAQTTAIQQYPSTGMASLWPDIEIDIQFSGAQPALTDIYFLTEQYGWIPLVNLTTGALVSSSQMTMKYDKGTYGMLTVLAWDYRRPEFPGIGQPQVTTFDLWKLDSMRDFLIGSTNTNVPLYVNTLDIEPYKWLYEIDSDGIATITNTQEGLALKTYQSDLFNNWMDTTWIEGPQGVSGKSAISTTLGYFTMDQLNLSQKVYNIMSRIALSGGTYYDWLDAVYDHDKLRIVATPVYHGGLSKEVVFQEVIATAQSTSSMGLPADQPLGTLAGRGRLSDKHKGGTLYIKVNEPSFIIGIVSLTPRIDYSQGNDWTVHLKTMDDVHKPALDEIGYQDLVTEQLAWWETEYSTVSNTWVKKSAGKQPAWLNYMTNVNKTYGNFAIATNEMFMTLNRRYEFDEINQQMKDLTTYIDPAKYNFIFAQPSIDAMNFWLQIGAKVIARRKMSAKIIPNL